MNSDTPDTDVETTNTNTEETAEPQTSTEQMGFVPSEKIAFFVVNATTQMFKTLDRKIRKTNGRINIHELMQYMGMGIREHINAIEQGVVKANSLQEPLNLYQRFLAGFIKEEDQ